jgi:pimeloyl-ACP methyl ester carboxylesterase
MQSVERRAAEDLTLPGNVRCRLHGAPEGNAGIVWVFGAGGGLGGPAGGVYERLAHQLQPEGITSLQVAYRQPGHMRHCVEDTVAGAAFVETLGVHRVVLVGHSFGGAVVINAGAVSPNVIAVAALSSQSHGAGAANRLGKPLLLIHGEADEILPPVCSQTLYHAAYEPKELILYPGCLHGLDQCREELDRDLTSWLLRIFQLG